MSFEERTNKQREKLRADKERVFKGEMELDQFIDDNFDILYDMHMSDMPYGTAKARDGDPHSWLYDFYYNEFMIGGNAT